LRPGDRKTEKTEGRATTSGTNALELLDGSVCGGQIVTHGERDGVTNEIGLTPTLN